MTSPSANKHKDQTESKKVSQSLSDSMSIYGRSFWTKKVQNILATSGFPNAKVNILLPTNLDDFQIYSVPIW